MTTNQSTSLVKNPNTKKAIAVLERFAKLESQYKALEAESKAATEQIKEAMIEAGVTKITLDSDMLEGYITLAERTSYKAIGEVSDEFTKKTLDTAKVKAHATLTGDLPVNVKVETTQYITKKIKVLE